MPTMQTVGGIKLITALIVSAFAFAIAKASADTEADIQNIMDKMTLAEKQAMCHGDGQMHGGGCPRLGIGRITMTDGPLGVRRIPPSTGFGSGLIVAQTWNADLHYGYGLVLGKETDEDGADMLLGPGINIVRDLVSGRHPRLRRARPRDSTAERREQRGGKPGCRTCGCRGGYRAPEEFGQSPAPR